MIAVSLPGRAGNHSASKKSAMSSRRGLTYTKSIPTSRACLSWVAASCTSGPPGSSWVFFRGAPPNITISRVLAMMLFQPVAGPHTGDTVPTMCGSSVSAAPKL